MDLDKLPIEKVEWIVEPDVSEAGDTTGTAKLTFLNGTTRDVEIAVKVKERQVTWTGQIVIDGEVIEEQEFTGTEKEVSQQLQILANTYTAKTDKYKFLDSKREGDTFIYEFESVVEEPEEPIEPEEPENPIDPEDPGDSDESTDPEDSTNPEEPDTPDVSLDPEHSLGSAESVNEESKTTEARGNKLPHTGSVSTLGTAAAYLFAGFGLTSLGRRKKED